MKKLKLKYFWILLLFLVITAGVAGTCRYAVQNIDYSQYVERVQNTNILEDNDMNWEIAEAILGMQGIVADRAENGKLCIEMLEAAAPGYYAMILMDVRMPVMGGREATRQIRGDSRSWINKIPVIAMTADAFTEDIQECLEAGMNDHISKPIDVERLFQVIKKYCG